MNFVIGFEDTLKCAVISRLMVSLHEYIDLDSYRYWQRGVLLKHGDAKGVVVADENKNTITIAIDSSSRDGRDLLTIIRQQIRRINGPHLDLQELVPLM